MGAISYILMGLVPLGVLNFVLKWKSIKKAYITVKSFHNLSKISFVIINPLNLSIGNRV